MQSDHTEKLVTVQCTGQRPWLQFWNWLVWPHATPPWAGLMLTLRVRVCWPMPQLTEQELHAVHVPKTQSMGQSNAMHQVVSAVAPQATPPCAALRLMWRVRSREPVPQVCVHVVHPPHVPCTQSTGHAEELHDCCSERNGHV